MSRRVAKFVNTLLAANPVVLLSLAVAALALGMIIAIVAS